MILNVNICSIINKGFHCVHVAFSSCKVQGGPPLVEREQLLLRLTVFLAYNRLLLLWIEIVRISNDGHRHLLWQTLLFNGRINKCLIP